MGLHFRQSLSSWSVPRACAARLATMLLWVASFSVSTGTAIAAGCDNAKPHLGVSRIVEIDANNGPIFGSISKRLKETSFLRDKEVVLTFDDGPSPWTTGSILDALASECTKATFFSVGKMALAYPKTAQRILTGGHTLGGHTHTHTKKLLSLPPAQAIDEIEKGMGAVAAAVGQPIAPFFRFPGLRDSDGLLGYLQDRDIATFTVDVVSNDSFINNPVVLTAKTISQVRSRGGGIILFHDIKSVTVKALPQILAGLRSEGFKIVHLVAKRPLKVLDRFERPVFEAALLRSQSKNNSVAPVKNRSTHSSSWAAADQPREDIDLEPSSFEDAIHALSVADTTDNGPPVTKVHSPKRERRDAWRYMAPPAPQISPRRGASLDDVEAVPPKGIQ